MNDLHTPGLMANDISTVFDHAHLDSVLDEIEAHQVADQAGVHAYFEAFEQWIEDRSLDGSISEHTLDAFRGHLWFGRGLISVHDGDIDIAIDYFQRSVERCKTTGNAKRRTLSLTRLALSLEYAGLQAASTRTIFEALDLAESLDDQHLVAHVLLTLCGLYDSQGAYQQLLETSMQTREVAEELGDLAMALRADNGVGLAFGFLDQAADGIAWIERAISGYGQQLPALASKLKLNLIWLYLRAGRPDEAAELAEQQMTMIAGLPGPHAAAIYVDIAEVNVAAGNLERATEVLDLAKQGLGEEPLKSQLLRYYEIAADLHEATGDTAQSLTMLRRHLALSAELRGKEANARLVAAERHFARELAAKTEEIHHLRTVELVEKNEQLAALNHQKDEILNVVVHDLRNPLAATQMLSESLMIDVEHGIAGDRREHLAAIREATSEMGATIDTLLHLQEHASPSVLTPVDEVVSRSIAWAEGPASKRQIDLRADISSTDLKVDGALLRRSLDDVLWAGVQAAAPGETISVAVEPAGRGAIVTIASRTAASTNNDGALYIARRLVERMHGSITVDVSDDAGTTTVINLRGS